MIWFACLAAMTAPKSQVLIGNLFAPAPNGVAFISADRSQTIVMDPGGSYFAGTAAPDDSYHQTTFKRGSATITFEWGRVGDGIIGRFTSDAPTNVDLNLGKTWHGEPPRVMVRPDAIEMGDWSLRSSDQPTRVLGATVTLPLGPRKRLTLAAGFGDLPSPDEVDVRLESARLAYRARRPAALGEWGDFVSAIADNLNNSRVYSSDDQRVAITVSRGWAPNPDNAPYFCWDSFFNGALACLDDPKTARETVRAILSWQTPEGMVPNFGHWQFADGRSSLDRSQPPVGSMCVWQLNQRWPDRGFLQEVYPKLLAWHRWWPRERDGRHDGLLEWGSANAGEQGARWETGWDDTVHFEGAHMQGQTLDAYAVDLNSLWAMDAEYLGLIADALGHSQEANELRAERKRTLELINAKLWNAELGVYCSRLWDGRFLTRLTPMNFYPLIAGAPDADRARQTLAVMTDPKRFWGRWILPTVAYEDPVWPQQDYWRGKVWAPVNYLVSKGLHRYASPELTNEFAARSVELFMRNWTSRNLCGENYLSTTGDQSSDPHYTWGALLCLIGIENICGFEPDGRIRLNGTLKQHMVLRNIPIGGRLYEVRVDPGITTLTRNGKPVLQAHGAVVYGPPPSS